MNDLIPNELFTNTLMPELVELDLFNAGPVACFVWDVSNDWPITFASQNIVSLLGFEPGTMTHPHFHYPNHIYPDDLVKTMVDIRLNLAQNKDRWDQVYRFFKADGTVIWLHHFTTTRRDDQGKIVQLSAHVMDVTQQKLLEIELVRMATIDTLTGCLNRGELMKRLETEFIRFKRNGKPLSVLMLDIDHFKSINDYYGHAIGDETLQHFVGKISQQKRAVDILGRMGGEEFILVLPETTIDGAQTLANKLCATIHENPLIRQNLKINYTVSIGVATSHQQHTKTVDALLHDADMGLYQAKQSGRNRALIYTP